MALLIILIYVNLLIKILAKENYTNLAIFKFKTFNSTTSKILQNNTEFNSKDFKSYIFSNVYLELEVGDETDYKTGENQILNTLIDSNTNSLNIKQINNNINILCHYNSSSSNTYRIIYFKSTYCKVEEKIKIYNDINLKNYKYISLVFDNNKCVNDSLCGNAGVDILSYNNKESFIYQLHNILNISEQNWAFLFSSKDEGMFIYGDLPHNYIKNVYKESNLVSFYSKISYFEITMDSIIFEDKNNTRSDFGDNNDYINIEISPDIEGIEFGNFYFGFIYDYFLSYIKNDICKSEVIDITITVIVCDGSKFGEKDIETFPKIIFKKYKLDFNISFENNELFYYRDSKYFFKIYQRFGKSKKFILGRMFLKKYLTIFNAEKKQIYFYNNKQTDKGDDAYETNNYFLKEWWKIILILFLLCIVIFLVIGIIIGKILFKNRKKHANELDDNYIYQENNNKNEYLYHSDKEIN